MAEQEVSTFHSVYISTFQALVFGLTSSILYIPLCLY